LDGLSQLGELESTEKLTQLGLNPEKSDGRLVALALPLGIKENTPILRAR